MAKDVAVTWYEVPNTGKKRVPAWGRRCAFDAEGTLWVPAVLGGNETAVLLACGFDATPTIINKGHIYVPSAWMAKEFPALAELMERIRENVERSESDGARNVVTGSG